MTSSIAISFKAILTILLLFSVISGKKPDDDSPNVVKFTAANVNDKQYTFRLGMGKIGHEIQWMNMAFDTSSINNWVASMECENCNMPQGFDTRAANHIQYTSQTVGFDQGHIHGYWGKGDVYVSETDEKQVLKDLPYLVAKKIIKVPSIQGGGSIGAAHATTQEEKDKVSFMKLLVSRGIISKKVATLHYSSVHSSIKEESWIAFGEAVAEGKNQDYEYNGHVADGAKWFTLSTIAHIGEKKLDIIESFVHTNNSAMLVSKSVFKTIMNEIKNSDGYVDGDEQYCLISKFPDLRLVFSDKTFVMKPSHYMGYNPQKKECFINIEPKILPADDVIVLGVPFLRTVNLVLDYENNRIGLAPSNNSDPVYPEGERLQEFPAWGYVLIALLVTVGITFVVVYIRKRYVLSKLQQHYVINDEASIVSNQIVSTFEK